jgi:4-hydroxy-tetrahydrodipicolinate synthase
MFNGTFTALITPMTGDGHLDCEGLERLVEFQIASGISGLVIAGTTGESPTLAWEEHCELIDRVCRVVAGRCTVIAGTGSNSTSEALATSEHAARAGADGLLLVDPYYNGPSSLEIRREYLEPVASRFPELQVIPYLVPGRTGTALLPQDLAILADRCPNVRTVKEATGDPQNAACIRQLCGPDFTILSGDDDRTLAMIADPSIAAAGAISVWSNLFPGPLQQMTESALSGDTEFARKRVDALAPLLASVHVQTVEASPHGPVQCKARSPLPVKTLMHLLGLPAGPCRQPLGRMTRAGLQALIDATRRVYAADPTLFNSIADFFTIDIEVRLADSTLAAQLTYPAYEAESLAT